MAGARMKEFGFYVCVIVEQADLSEQFPFIISVL
jgi:hypothetical protein